ncbi:matrixin family metalloprotease [Haloferula sp.]|uniref:matrixin family metalloprotease n=1 Tax=Haloferula sp. TaxID=2497595 RepID=UPI00329B984D
MMRRNLIFPALVVCVIWPGSLPAESGGHDHAHHNHDHGHENQAEHGEKWQEHLGKLKEQDRRNLERVTEMLDPDLWERLAPARKRQLLSYTKNRFDSERPLAICWKPGTPMATVEAYRAVEISAREYRGKPLRIGAANQVAPPWGSTATSGGTSTQGRPVTLTWSFLPDGTGIPAAFTGDSSNPSNFRAWIVGIYGGDAALPPEHPTNAAWFSLFEDMFASYAAKTGLRYVYEPNDDGATFPNFGGSTGVRGDLRIGGHEIDANGDENGSTLAYNYFPNTGDMVIDTADDWFAGSGIANNSRGMRNVLEHEHGHGVGLEHVCPVNQTKLMEPFISVAYLGLQFDDQYSASRSYGDFYERHGVSNDNDSFANAADLGLAAGVQFGFEWLSIDDNSDVDYYSFPVPSGAQVTARIVPSTASYLEGSQNTDGSCSGGTTFDSSIQHDLVLELFGPSQNLLATRDLTAAGSPEEILSLPVSGAGTHYIRVNGGTSDSSQMYRLEVLVELPSVALTVQSYEIQLESLLPANGVVDPRETVRVAVDIGNSGTQSATNVQGTVSGPGGFTGFDTVHDYGSVGSGGSGSGTFVFGLDGAFGETVSIDLQLTADGGVSEMTPLTFTLGKETQLMVPLENFDSGGSLPAGWSNSTTSSGSGWSVVTADFKSPTSSAFVQNTASRGTSVLTSPSLMVPGGSGALSFWHRYNTEAGNDGGVLEVSVNSGAWSDVLAAGCTFLENGYSGTLGGPQNPLTGRSGWTGNSGAFVQTSVDLPSALLNQPIRFRWIMAQDRNGSEEGWFVDDVVTTTAGYETPGVPQLDLAVVDGTAAEFGGTDTAEVQVVTPLPMLDSVALSLTTGGSAEAEDVTGLGLASMPAAQTEEPIILTAVSDEAVEGPETLTLDLDASTAFLPGSNGQAAVTISDTPYGQWAFTNLGAGPLNGPLEDKDGDFYNNTLEYAFGTDGDSTNDHPVPVVFEDGGLLKISAPLATLPIDVVMFAQQSVDLTNWDSVGMQTLSDAFAFPMAEEQQFLRIGVELVP